jgi:hypothetical protein
MTRYHAKPDFVAVSGIAAGSPVEVDAVGVGAFCTTPVYRDSASEASDNSFDILRSFDQGCR